MANLYTKYEVSRCTRHKAMNGGAKGRNRDGLGWLGGTQGHGQCHHSTERIYQKFIVHPLLREPRLYNFLFNFNRNYAAILYRFQGIASYLSKVADFNLTHLHLVTKLVVTPVEFR